MRIAISAQGEDLQSEVDPRFGRTKNFLIIETDTMAVEVVKNDQNLELPQGAGIQAAQHVARHKPDAVLTGHCGPKAFKVLQTAGIPLAVGVKGRIRDAVLDYLNGKYETAKAADVDSHWI